MGKDKQQHIFHARFGVFEIFVINNRLIILS